MTRGSEEEEAETRPFAHSFRRFVFPITFSSSCAVPSSLPLSFLDSGTFSRVLAFASLRASRDIERMSARVYVQA